METQMTPVIISSELVISSLKWWVVLEFISYYRQGAIYLYAFTFIIALYEENKMRGIMILSEILNHWPLFASY